jgi:phosphoglycolate phosphatase-like HAD superfamily hydrolase
MTAASTRLPAILDIDGTLVDTNYHHAIAWYRAFRKFDLSPPVWRIHRHIGMGGDQLIAAVAGDEVEDEFGDDIRDVEGDLYMQLIDEVQPLEGGRELIVSLKDSGHRVVLASSAKEQEVDHYLDLLEVRDVVDDWTTSADVENTKPAPDLVESALKKMGVDKAVLVGDSTFDIEAALRAEIGTLAVLTGGFSEDELMEVGALRVFGSIVELNHAMKRGSLEEVTRRD